MVAKTKVRRDWAYKITKREGQVKLNSLDGSLQKMVINMNTCNVKIGTCVMKL